MIRFREFMQEVCAPGQYIISKQGAKTKVYLQIKDGNYFWRPNIKRATTMNMTKARKLATIVKGNLEKQEMVNEMANKDYGHAHYKFTMHKKKFGERKILDSKEIEFKHHFEHPHELRAFETQPASATQPVNKHPHVKQLKKDGYSIDDKSYKLTFYRGEHTQ